MYARQLLCRKISEDAPLIPVAFQSVPVPLGIDLIVLCHDCHVAEKLDAVSKWIEEKKRPIFTGVAVSLRVSRAEYDRIATLLMGRYQLNALECQ